jgi:hypothetical protein
MTTQLEQAQAALAKAQEANRRAEAVAERKVHEAEQRRAAALAEWDRQIVEAWDRERKGLFEDRAAKRTEFNAALEAWSVIQAGAEYYAAQRVLTLREGEVWEARIRLGLQKPPELGRSIPGDVRADPPDIPVLVKQAIESIGANLAADIQDAREQARSEAGEAAARGETGSPST